MQYTGEIIALGVACSWTVTALFAEEAIVLPASDTLSPT